MIVRPEQPSDRDAVRAVHDHRGFDFEPARPRGLFDEFRGGDAFQVIEFRGGAIDRNAGPVRYAPEFSLVAD